MTARDDAIEAGARTLLRPDVYGLTLEDAAEFAAAVVDAVEPIFEAEADRRVDRMILWNTNHLASLRAQVEALPQHEFLVGSPLAGGGWAQYAAAGVRRSDVLALLGGESDE